MQIILASAKIMNDRVKSIPDISLSTPRFQNEAEGFARDMVQYSAESIAEMLGCSQQIAAQNRLRYMRFFEDSAKLPAILAYHGQAYKHLKAETLTVDDLNVAQGKLWITSLNFCSSKGFTKLFTMQGQCKPNAESLLYAEVQPVLALDFEGKDRANL
jgi:hypothetical protein